MEQKEMEPWLNLLEKQFIGSEEGVTTELFIAQHNQLSGETTAQHLSFEEGARIMAYL